MRALFTALALSLAMPLAACSGGADAAADSAPTIPLTIAAADGTVHRFAVEVARSEEEQRKGLMFRTELPAGTGMLFPFPKPRIASFWMKDTLIPLDMIFIRSDGRIDRIAENMLPESLEPVVSGGEVAAVLEVAGGTAADLGLDEDAKVTWTNGER